MSLNAFVMDLENDSIEYFSAAFMSLTHVILLCHFIRQYMCGKYLKI